MTSINSSKRNLTEHPQYFGVYANMARHNVFKILHHIAEKTGLPGPSNEESIEKAKVVEILNPEFSDDYLQLGKINKPEKIRQVIVLLHEHFRFLNALNNSIDAANPDPKKYYDIVFKFLQQLNKSRNELTHAIVVKNPFAKIIRNLEYIFDDALVRVTERFELTQPEIMHLKRYDGLDRKTKKAKENPGFKHRFFENNTITEKGLAFFICLFLEKEYISVFVKRLRDFKAGNSKAFRASVEVYSVLNCKLPQNKLQGTNDAEATLLLDMLNELQRCPKELYDLLSPENKKKFETTAIGIEDDEAEKGDEGVSILLRNGNRFPYFALRYIDSMNIFEKLRFHIDLGNYHFHSYEKQMDNQTIIRRWEKKLLSFGKLGEISESSAISWKDLIKDPSLITDETPAPFIIRTQPHYHFSGEKNGNIGLKSMDSHSIEFPSLVPDKRPATSEPDYYLCTDELTGLLLYNYFIEEFKGRNAEKLIEQFKERTEKLLDAIAKGIIKPISKEKITNQYGMSGLATFLRTKEFENEFKERKDWLAGELGKFELEPHQVPDSMCKYLMGLEPVDLNERAAMSVHSLLKETDLLLNRINDPANKLDKKNKKLERKKRRNLHLSAGDSASFLAEDLMKLQPPLMDEHGKALPKGKANSDEYKLLQSRIAFFPVEKNNLQRTFQLCKLVESKNPHPFIHHINLENCEDVLSFYSAYLNERRRFLQGILEKKNYSDYYFLAGNEPDRDSEYFISLAKTIKSKPINLPRGLFKDALINVLKQKDDIGMKEIVKGENVRHNVIFIINEWFRQGSDGYQPFYDYKRNYRTVDEWFDRRTGQKDMLQSLPKLYKSPSELSELAQLIKNSERMRKNGKVVFYKVYKEKVIENEKLIRHYRGADQMLFLMCKKILVQQDKQFKEAFKGGFFLKDISPDNDASILESRVPFSLPVKTKSGRVKMIKEEFKIKDYGKLRKYLKDRRLDTLLDYFEESEVSKKIIDDELKKYEKFRVLLFDYIYLFETACNNSSLFEEYIPALLKEMNTVGEHRNYAEHSKLLEKYCSLFNVTDSERDHLNIIRNAFSHNQYPDKNKINSILKNERPIIEEIMDFALPLYEKYTNNLKQS